jgi:hypothetical protein
MNLVGKIFTLFIFVASLVFMSFTVVVYASKKNWKDVVENPTYGYVQKLKDVKKINDDLIKERDNLNTQLADVKKAHQTALGKLESENDALKKDKAKFEAQLAEMQGKVDAAIVAMNANERTLEAARKQNDDLRKEIIEAVKDRDVNFNKVVRLTDELHNAVNERTRLNERNLQLVGEHAKALEVLRKFKLKPEPGFYLDLPPQGLTGIVLAAEPKLIEVSIGDDDGLLAGHNLEVYRGNGRGTTYVGRVKVLRTSPDRAVCEIIPEMLRTQVLRGDYVAAKLN